MKTSTHHVFSSLRFPVALLGLVLVTAGVHGTEGSPDLHLVFTGSGTVTKAQTSYTNHYNRKTRKFETGTVTSVGRKPFTGSGYIDISGNTSRIKLPRSLMPLFSGGHEGWYDIRNLSVGEREINGVVRINALNKPKLHIDRATGVLSLEGYGEDFTGQCNLVNADATQRKF